MLLRNIARFVAVVWAGWWAVFGLLSGLGEGADVWGVVLHTLVPGGIFLLIAAIAWRWEFIGGSLLVFVGLATFQYYPFASSLPGALTLSLPPIVAGFLLLWDRIRPHRPSTPPRHTG
jgi:hypothetical protein